VGRVADLRGRGHRGLSRTALILAARHGASIGYEGVLRTFPPVGGPRLRFGYPASSGALGAAQAAVDAWNALPVDAHYRVLDADGVLHFVPYEARNADGTCSPFHPLMDTKVHLVSTRGTPTDLYHQVLKALVAASGVAISDDYDGLVVGNVLEREEDGWPGQQAVVTLPSADGTARELMDAVLLAADRQTGWSLAWIPGPENGGTGGWAFTFTLAGPEKEFELNGTPLGPS
jgi:hypothetical protein